MRRHKETEGDKTRQTDRQTGRQAGRQTDRETERQRETQSLNLLSICQWVRSDIYASQQQTSPISFLSLKLPPHGLI